MPTKVSSDLDLQVAYEAQRAKCATAVLFNKWDISEIDLDLTVARVKAKVQMRPRWLTVSALTRRGVDRILPLAKELHGQYSARYPPPSSTLAGAAPRPEAGGRQGGQGHQDLLCSAVRDVPPRFQGHGERSKPGDAVVRILSGEPPARRVWSVGDPARDRLRGQGGTVLVIGCETHS